MIKISCYRTTGERLSKAFCMLAEKCYHNQIKIFVHTNTYELLDQLDKYLWTYSKKQFIPHATIHDQLAIMHPILLGEEFKNYNNSSSMMIINADSKQLLNILSTSEDFNKKCERLFFLFDENYLDDTEIQEIITKSSLGEFSLETYVQEANGSWRSKY